VILRSLLILLLLLTSCGYRFEGGEKIAISIPYVQGEFEGELTDALAAALSNTSQFRYTRGPGDWTLKAKLLGTENDNIGYRYDQKPLKGTEQPNVIAVENRKIISVEVSVVNSTTGTLVWGPHILKADTTYDYVDPNALSDVAAFFRKDAEGDVIPDSVISTMDFSLGQLDSVGAAGEDAIYPIYKEIARKVVEGLVAAGD